MRYFIQYFIPGLYPGLFVVFFWATASLSGAEGAAATETHFDLSGTVRVTKISDGDSVRSGSLRIRLFGIDAPEIKQQCQDQNGADWTCGIAARNKLQDLVSTSPYLTCNLRDVDRYGRLVMQCFAGATDIGAAMVEAGYALAYRRYAEDYHSQEQQAQKSRRGIWKGAFMPPWDWRKAN
jgi:endonuclease YncB( thermonuclease family)